MDSCKNFAKKYPVLIAVLTTLLVFVLLKIRYLIPEGPVAPGIREVFLAVVVFAWTFLFMGKEKVTFKPDGFRYSFRILRGYFIFLGLFVLVEIVSSVVLQGIHSTFAVKLVNACLIGATVGIVEEFSFRGLVFGGFLQKLGSSKKNIIIASILSGLLFGAMHVVYSVLEGEVTSFGTGMAALFKTIQTGIFGVTLAFIYYTTKNIYAVAALHSLDDFLLFLLSSVQPSEAMKADSYVSGNTTVIVVGYTIFTLIMVPALIKAMKDLKENEAIPFDEDFQPRAVKYEKK